VQGELERALSRALGEETQVKGAGRTDAGVHARGQVASFATSSPLPVHAIAPAVLRHLPEDVRVDEIREVDADFDARRSATGRHYRYQVLQGPDVLSERYAWWPRATFDFDGLARATAVLEGEHDFSSFQSAGSTQVRPTCRVWRATWSRWERGVCFDVVADHFLYRMVRTIVGTAVGLSREAGPAAAMRRLLVARDRRRAGKAAPAGGLSLECVFYEDCRA
jgi:tRNA pseudouridine38-40 synthase